MNLKIKSLDNCVEALQYVYVYKPDLILTDIVMPKMSGLEFLKIIKKNCDEEIPIILISSHDNLGLYRSKAELLGAEDYLDSTQVYTQLVPSLKRVVCNG